MTQRLPDTREMALAIAENSVHGVVVMDAAGYCLYANRAWQEMTGFSAEEMQAAAVHDLVHHHHPDGRPFPIDECPIGCTLGKNQTVRNHHDLFFRKDGTPFHVSCAASPIVGPGEPVRMILEIRDITAEKEADRRKDEFLAMLAHELRNPLAPIAAAAELLALGHAAGERAVQSGAIIARQVRHMTGLVDDLLDVSRVTRGLIALERASLDIKAIVFEAIEQVRPLIEARRHRLVVQALPGPALVRGDRKRLVQVMANLLNNAAKYTPEAGEVSLAVEVDDDMVRVTVRDNGIGMTPDMVARAFDLFSQAQRTPDRAQGGLGIGLALVKSLVELHGGRVAARSDGSGRGAVFAVLLPQADDVVPGADAGGIAPALQSGSAPLSIVVVDDNADAAWMLAMLLETMGHAVHVAHDAAGALQAAAQRHDVFLLDIGLPGMDGRELARRLRAMPQQDGAMLVAITGYGQDIGAGAGFDHHLVKPADPARLAALLAQASGR